MRVVVVLLAIASRIVVVGDAASYDETVQGLLPSLQAAALAVGLQSMPSVKYAEGCCE